MVKEQIVDLLQTNGYTILSDIRMNNDLGFQIRCETGEIIAIYDSGKIVPQGKNIDRIKELFGQPKIIKNDILPAINVACNRKVFVVYGHDNHARTELEAMLRRWGLQPQILDQLPSSGQTIIEKLESVRKEVNFCVVLATPDDEGYRASHPDEKAFRARQNVVLELGMMLHMLGRDRVAILLKDQVSMERPSDIQGLIYIPFKDSVSEAALQLAKEINNKSILIDLDKV